MRVRVSIPMLGIDVDGEWDGQRVTVNRGMEGMTKEELVKGALRILEARGIVIELAGSHGPCGCGRGDIFFPPMCERCWEEYGEAVNKHNKPEVDHTKPPPLLRTSQEQGKASQDPDKWEPKLLDGWSWGTDKPEDKDEC